MINYVQGLVRCQCSKTNRHYAVYFFDEKLHCQSNYKVYKTRNPIKYNSILMDYYNYRIRVDFDKNQIYVYSNSICIVIIENTNLEDVSNQLLFM